MKNIWAIWAGVLLGLFLAGLVDAQGAQIRLAWDPPASNTDGTVPADVSGYRVYRGTTSSNYPIVIDAGNVTSSPVIVLSDPVAVWTSTNTAQSYTTNTWPFTGPTATLASNQWCFTTRAYNPYLTESEPSTELMYQLVTNLSYRASWGKTWTAATNPLVVVGVNATRNKTDDARATLFIRWGIVNGPDFPCQSTIGNTKPGPPTSQRVTS